MFCGAVLVLLVCAVCSCRASEIQTIEADLGKDVVLDCRGSSSNRISAVGWVRADKGPEEYIFYFDGSTASRQISSYRGRVSLQDPDMKDGDVSVLLKNVTISDNGTYECLTVETKAGRRKRAAGPNKPQSRNKIQLTVRDPVSGEQPRTGTAGPIHGPSPKAAGPRGRIGLLVAAGVVGAVMLTVSGVVWKQCTTNRAE